MKTQVLILPGFENSGPEHWQSHWEKLFPEYHRVVQDDWFRPNLNEWVETLDEAIQRAPLPVTLVAHSLACALVSHWSQRKSGAVQAAFLVSPSDVDSAEHTPDILRGFSPMPTASLPFKSIVVASTNDPYVSFDRAQYFAQCWGSQLVNIGEKGHINADSNLNTWLEGQVLLKQIMSAQA